VLCTDLSIGRVETAQAAGLNAVPLGANGDLSALRALMPLGAEIVVDATGYAPAIHTSGSLVVDKPWDGIRCSRSAAASLLPAVQTPWTGATYP